MLQQDKGRFDRFLASGEGVCVCVWFSECEMRYSTSAADWLETVSQWAATATAIKSDQSAVTCQKTQREIYKFDWTEPK